MHRKFPLHTEKSFRNLIKWNRNQIVFNIFRLIWNQTDSVRLVFQINRKMVNIIWFRFWFSKIWKRYQCAWSQVYSKRFDTRSILTLFICIALAGIDLNSTLHGTFWIDVWTDVCNKFPPLVSDARYVTKKQLHR